MEKRYYYTDPLAAAWMAKHFGMRFERWNWNNEQFVFENDDVDLEDTTLYIHPDSLHLLERQSGDLVQNGGGGVFEVLAAGKVSGVLGEYTYGDLSIIQREGILFHWPEVEQQ